jgi:hypothetical protein
MLGYVEQKLLEKCLVFLKSNVMSVRIFKFRHMCCRNKQFCKCKVTFSCTFGAIVWKWTFVKHLLNYWLDRIDTWKLERIRSVKVFIFYDLRTTFQEEAGTIDSYVKKRSRIGAMCPFRMFKTAAMFTPKFGNASLSWTQCSWIANDFSGQFLRATSKWPFAPIWHQTKCRHIALSLGVNEQWIKL